MCTQITQNQQGRGHHSIPAKTLKLGARELAAPLKKLYNLCISNGKWPCEWKKGIWSPIFKKDDPLDRENYTGQLQSIPPWIKSWNSWLVNRLQRNLTTTWSNA